MGQVIHLRDAAGSGEPEAEPAPETPRRTLAEAEAETRRLQGEVARLQGEVEALRIAVDRRDGMIGAHSALLRAERGRLH